ncbi:cytochrome c biogenesis CcdA family protein [Mycobacterium sp. AZCC_0083]|uniref:cytochrome c biogenesis CcdA family protein n=1 Tax=Mycobacterium sp. AZCC_0083 TaxID=2735882 RepID=UPI0016124E7E|nr:cytochrome c biogenesis CcdA family protein [Mycobacterium sp. AZCC_0083]MBB5161729.1 cytochrome c biogenesis protein CcdA [Mycobacterium sp. AZCC_0083]
MGEVLLGTTLLASFLGGVVALLAPCCISVMLPAYLSTGFRHRGGVVPATLVFGAGVATVILPIGLGATALSSLLLSGHVWVFSVGGVLMIGAGAATLAGWKATLPMPGARAAREGSFGSAYVLGAFSGAASACCAPVLAGVAVLSGAAASFPVALGIGAAYVAGMVTPLAVTALLWDKRRERATRLLTERTVRLRLGRWHRRMLLGSALSGLLMITMGVLAVVLAFTGPGMPSGGWQTELSAWLQHISSVALTSLSWIPGWVLLAALLVGLAVLIRRALRTSAKRTTLAAASSCCADDPESAIPATADTVEENRREQDQR